MAKELEKNSLHIEPSTVALENGEASKDFDDDGRSRRTGTVLTASAHIITAVIGSGVLSLAWAIAQLGWVAGPAVLVAFSFITYLTSTFLADSYRHQGRRNYTYMDVVRSHLGGYKVQLCGVAQYGNLIGVTIGYTITASISMVAVKRSNCFHKEGHEAACSISTYPFMAIFGGIQLVLSQIPNFHELSWLSIVAAVMSFAYSSIGFALSVAKLAGGGGHVETGLTGTRVGVDTSASEKVWKSFQAIGDIAFAYAFSTILIEIQDTLKSPPPENVAMKKASLVGVSTTTLFYVLCGCLGYAAFGNDAPGNFLTGFGFYEPFWLIDFANVCIAIHLIGAYQAAQKKLLHRLLKITTISIFGLSLKIMVFAQPLFGFVEDRCRQKWPENKGIAEEHAVRVPLCGVYNFNVFRLVWRSVYVIITSLIAMIFPFFNNFLGLIGASAFYPLTVYFPIEMHIAQAKVPKYSCRWVWLKILSWACLIVSLVAAAGSVRGLAADVKTYKPFQSEAHE
ncbi:amino acid permease 6-like isoform X1 [Salvia splendens]|uniref:amino acid permease 6-like isoform X1 n=1 Tax=Salvia splendens TaxID=180675 RepID=UPI001C26DAB9|nr:amino acid permease 6-like isoform X1 [Salvia splendens]